MGLLFSYFAKDANGKCKEGTIEATSQEDAFFKLREQGLTVLDIKIVEAEAEHKEEPETGGSQRAGGLLPDEKKRIYEEEKVRLEAQEKAKKELAAQEQAKIELATKEASKKINKGCLGCLGSIIFIIIIIFISSLSTSPRRTSSKRATPTKAQEKLADEAVIQWTGRQYDYTTIPIIRKKFGNSEYTSKTNNQYSYIYFKKPNITFKVNKTTNKIEHVYSLGKWE